MPPKLTAEEREARRRRVLRAASELYAEKGLNSTTLDEIAERAQVSGASEISRLFRQKSYKETILIEIFRLNWRYVLGVTRNIANNSSRNARQKLLLIYRRILERIIKSGSFGIVFAMEGRKHGSLGVKLIGTGAIEFAVLIDGIIQEGQQTKIFLPNLNVQAIRQMLIGCCENIVLGLIWQTRAPHLANYTLDDAYRALEAILDGISVKISQMDTEKEQAR